MIELEVEGSEQPTVLKQTDDEHLMQKCHLLAEYVLCLPLLKPANQSTGGNKMKSINTLEVTLYLYDAWAEALAGFTGKALADDHFLRS